MREMTFDGKAINNLRPFQPGFERSKSSIIMECPRLFIGGGGAPDSSLQP
jgi:hypothetical protein